MLEYGIFDWSFKKISEDQIYGIFDHGNEKLLQVKYTGTWYIRPSVIKYYWRWNMPVYGIFDLGDKLFMNFEYTGS